MTAQERQLKIAGIVSDYVARRIAAMNLPPDAGLSTDQHHKMIDEACSVVNVAVWWAHQADATWTAAGGPLADATPAPAPTAPAGSGSIISPLVNGVVGKALAAAGV